MLREEMKPTREVKRAAVTAVDDFLAYKSLGERFPHDGGYDDQPAEWVEAVHAVQLAHGKATGEIEERDRKRQEQEAKRKR